MPEQLKIPELRFPDFKNGWEDIRLGNLLEFKNGINASKEQYGSGVKFINVLDILENDHIVYEKIHGSVDINEATLKKNLVEYGDILFQRSSETREEVGTACVYLDKERTATFGGFVIRGKKIGDYEPVFLNRMLKTNIARKEITTKSGGSTRYNVGQEILASVILPFPSMPEQQKIASFFTDIDQKIFHLKQKKILLEQYKKGVMQIIFSQEFRFRNEKRLEFPKWKEMVLGDVFTSFKGKGLSKDLVIDSGSFKCVLYGELYTTYPEVIAQVISKTNSQEGILSKEGDLLLPCSTTTTGIDLANVTALNEGNVRLGGDITILRAKEEINNIFYAYYLSNYKKIHIARRAQGITIVHLSFSHIKDIIIDVPCLKEQTKIANLLSAIDDKINHTQTQIEKAELWKKGLLQKMFV